ncbi:MAG: sensor histidine kinase [Rhodocyclaceae bacterium]|nr:sensor histidine kinase [Rhodocyclaceae bacterium]
MQAPATFGPQRRARRLSIWAAAVLIVVAAAALSGFWTQRQGLARVSDTAQGRLDIYAAGLDAELRKFDYLPTLLELNPDVPALLRRPADAALRSAVNGYLERVCAQAEADVFYLLDAQGKTLAASNWRDKHSFVGMDLSFRPYFQDAVANGAGRFYGIGTTSGRPGYYLARSVDSEGARLGVAALKINLDGLERKWSGSPDAVLVTDANGIVILSSVPAWKYRPLRALAPAVAQKIESARQYEGVNLTPLALREISALADGARLLEAADEGAGRRKVLYLALDRPLPGSDWHMLLLSDLSSLTAARRNAAAGAALATAFLMLLALYLQQRRRAIAQQLAAKAALQRAHDELERKVVERTADLEQAYQNLQREMADRKRAEEELVQAGKMAVLGQMSAGITHELNQPLAALSTLADNTQKLMDLDRRDAVQKNLAKISQIVLRMGAITSRLKSFARKSTVELEPVPVHRAVANALFLLERRLRQTEVELQVEVPEQLAAQAEPVRLEQVIVNLAANAVDAMEQSPARQLSIRAEQRDDRLILSVADTGPGLADEILAHLFEPFRTTKPAGAGLGLGLVISAGIVRDFGGTLVARNLPAGGAEFTLTLAAAKESEHG